MMDLQTKKNQENLLKLLEDRIEKLSFEMHCIVKITFHLTKEANGDEEEIKKIRDTSRDKLIDLQVVSNVYKEALEEVKKNDVQAIFFWDAVFTYDFFEHLDEDGNHKKEEIIH